MLGTECLYGLITMIVCLIIQCTGVSYALKVVAHLEKRQLLRPTVFCTTIVLTVSLMALLAGNLLQVGIWAGLFEFLGEFSDFKQAYYHSIVNFSTLGYGDFVMSEKHKLLGGLEAVNGVIMFGLTTGFLYSVLNGLMRRAWSEAGH